MKKFTVNIPDDKVEAFETFMKQLLNISILKEDEKLMVEEWQRDTIMKDENTNDYISSDEIEKTSFSREK